ncbi:hypothetical protein U879_14670 [Defluviimonas sp. 20V17]|uniref:PAS domain-containing protein n=2 Tax=Allgaiera indica TaxID=765699 RepID=A0AAN4URT0_9RHOB|nr:hypothetical protein U879_14670 [Defluviimonas sp. 20V17]GHE01486.1 PAS domain-containing protein [Allgaiera indica]SDW87641.1 PAS domain-containing protein [Allgaiera indica]
MIWGPTDRMGRPGGGMQASSAGKVIALREYRQMRHDPLIQLVIGYWEALRAGRPAPLRAEIDPRGIEAALDRVFLAERIAPGVGRFRLAGMGLNDLMGMEVRGMPLTTLIQPDGRKRFAEALEQVFQGGTRCSLQLEAVRGLGRPELGGQMVLLPLVNDRGDNPLVLGCLSSEGSIGRAPRRMNIAALQQTEFEITAPDAPRPDPKPAPDALDRLRSKGFAEPQPPAFTPPPGKSRPALRLVKSDI